MELIDQSLPVREREASLDDVDRLNSWFGGYRLTIAAIRRALVGLPTARPALVVDVGGGRGDFARRLRRWARRRGRALRVVVLDRQTDVGVRTRDEGDGLLFICADATALPLREASVDVITASLTLHHLEPEQAATSLREMVGASRRGLVVNDLLRTRLTLALVWLATRVIARHPISRHDGPLSVRRAYTPDELTLLAEKAGVRRPAVRRYRLLGRVLAVITP